MDSELGREILECELCGCTDAVEIPYVRRYTDGVPYHVCKGCGLVYFKYRRTPQELAKYWEEEMFNKGNYVARNPYFKARHTYAAEFLDLHLGLKDKTLLDIGAGDGQFLEMVQKHGAYVRGIESSKTNHELMAKNGIENYLGTIEDYCKNEIIGKKVQPNADIVTILWTLQNSQSATDMLDTARDCLKDDGYLYLQMSVRVLMPFTKPLGMYLGRQPGDLHPYLFSIKSLQGFLNKCGFKIVKTNNYWDQEVINIIAKKADKNINFERDNSDDVLNFFIRWHNESIKMVDYVHVLDLDYKFYNVVTFYEDKGLIKK